MKFHCVRIQPDYYCNKWEVIFSYDDQEREDIETKPHSLGFYHYPVTLSKEDAFLRLKQSIIENHEKEIVRLAKSLEELKKFELPNKEKRRKKA